MVISFQTMANLEAWAELPLELDADLDAELQVNDDEPMDQNQPVQIRENGNQGENWEVII